jgi:hypothetical protein
LINSGVLIGGLLFGVGAAFALADDPVGHVVLALGARQTLGQPIAVEATWFNHHGPIYRCRYSFRTPDGVTRRGVSFLKTRPGPVVSLEYGSVHPGASRIRGALPGLCPPGLSVVMGLVSVAGLTILTFGLLHAWDALRLLRIGEVGEAKILSCAFTTRWEHSEKYTRSFDDVTFEQFRQTWLAGADYAPGGMKWVREFLRFRMYLMAVVGVFGVVLLAHILGLALFGDAPIRINDWPLSRTAGIALSAVVLVIFGLVVGWDYRFGRGAVGELSGPDVPARDKPPPLVCCSYDFALPDGTVIRSKDLLLFDERFGAGPAEMVLYDPRRPDRALLVHSLRPGVRLSPLGEWESTGNWVPWFRLAAVVAVSAAAFALFS